MLNTGHWPHTPWENMINSWCSITDLVTTYCSMSDTKLVVKAPEVRRVSDAVPLNRTQSSTSFTIITRTISPRYLPLIYFSNLQNIQNRISPTSKIISATNNNFCLRDKVQFSRRITTSYEHLMHLYSMSCFNIRNNFIGRSESTVYKSTGKKVFPSLFWNYDYF